jgi:predicted TIM-barrel fold metal-dependent hydrolase
LRFLIGEVGSDRIVIGTDLFAARDIEYPNSFVEQLKLPVGDLDRILRGNAKRLLHL